MVNPTTGIPSFGTPAVGNLERSDLYGIYNVVQNTLMAYPKDLVVSVLRDEFSKDSYYHFVLDEFGFPKTPDHTDMPLDAGFNDDQTTRIFIGEPWRFDVILYPAILVKITSAKYVPISMSRNKYVVEYDRQLFADGYGNYKEVMTPLYYDVAGVWEGNMQIDIIDRDILSRDNLVSLVMLMLADVKYENFRKAGLVLKPPSLSGLTEGDDRQQEKIYKATISVDYRTEWRRLIPIEKIVDKINVCLEFGQIVNNQVTGPTNPNFDINISLSILDQIENL
jgi:hypothetical protein